MEIDRVLVEIAARHLGLVPRAEVRRAGIHRDRIAERVRAGTMVELSPRVLRHAAVAPSDAQRALAGCLDVVGGAVLSFDAAAWWWGLPGFALRRVEVTARRSQRRTSDLAVVHRPTRHLPSHVTNLRGIEVTDLAWTIFNLASRHHPKRVERLVDTVCATSPSTLVALHRLVPEVSGQGMRGVVVLREVLDARPVGVRLPGSGAQRRFEELCAAAGVGGLRREVDLGGHEWVGRVDYVCELTGIVFEIDSELHHTSPSDVAADVARDAALIAAGAPAVVRIATELLWSNPAEAPSIVRSARSRYRSARKTWRSGPENRKAS